MSDPIRYDARRRVYEIASKVVIEFRLQNKVPPPQALAALDATRTLNDQDVDPTETPAIAFHPLAFSMAWENPPVIEYTDAVLACAVEGMLDMLEMLEEW